MFLPGASAPPTVPAGPVSLRPLVSTDRVALFEIFSHPELCRYLEHPPYQHLSQADDRLARTEAHFAGRTGIQWGMVENGMDRVIGTFSLHRIEIEHQRAEVGYTLHPSCWGRGYAKAAVEAGVRFAFEVLELHRLEADTDPRNRRSIRVLLGLGFVQDGMLKERYLVNGERQDAALFGLLRPDWARRSLPQPL
jgi:RimJ/RimL family protein N-acetyltransferase